MNLEKSKLKAFEVLARKRHFGHAAEARGISQPALSRHIQALKNRLAFALFDRHTRAVLLTHSGK